MNKEGEGSGGKRMDVSGMRGVAVGAVVVGAGTRALSSAVGETAEADSGAGTEAGVAMGVTPGAVAGGKASWCAAAGHISGARAQCKWIDHTFMCLVAHHGAATIHQLTRDHVSPSQP
jgi:hypothetical protein